MTKRIYTENYSHLTDLREEALKAILNETELEVMDELIENVREIEYSIVLLILSFKEFKIKEY